MKFGRQLELDRDGRLRRDVGDAHFQIAWRADDERQRPRLTCQLKTTDTVCRGCVTRSFHDHRRIDDWLTRGTRDDRAGKNDLALCCRMPGSSGDGHEKHQHCNTTSPNTANTRSHQRSSR